MVGVEGPAEVPGHRGAQTEAERAKPTLPGGRQRTKTSRERGRSGGREGHPSEGFSTAAATGPAATNASCARGDRHCNGSARRRASVPWSVSGNESGAGTGGTPGGGPILEGGPADGCRESAPDAEMSLPY